MSVAALPRPVAVLRDVSRVYDGPPRVSALVDVSLTVAAGEYVAVVGASGSGKSTLLHTLGLLDRASAGTYELDGHDTTGLSEGRRAGLRRDAISFVFQSFFLLPHLTAVENVALGLLYQRVPPSARAHCAETALVQVGLSSRMHALAADLSGGEQQRVAIARAIARRPALLLADEPTGNLDSRTASSIMELLDTLNRAGNTIVLVTHDANLSARAHRRVVMADGRVVDDG